MNGAESSASSSSYSSLNALRHDGIRGVASVPVADSKVKFVIVAGGRLTGGHTERCPLRSSDQWHWQGTDVVVGGCAAQGVRLASVGHQDRPVHQRGRWHHVAFRARRDVCAGRWRRDRSGPGQLRALPVGEPHPRSQHHHRKSVYGGDRAGASRRLSGTHLSSGAAPDRSDSRPHHDCGCGAGGRHRTAAGGGHHRAGRHRGRYRERPVRRGTATAAVSARSAEGEQKTKPTQAGCSTIASLGLPPQLIFCRSDRPLLPETRAKIALFAQVPVEAVVSLHDVSNTFKIPQMMQEQGVTNSLISSLHLSWRLPTLLERWGRMASAFDTCQGECTIAIVGKYTGLADSYLSVIKALEHAGMALHRKVHVRWVAAEELEEDGAVVRSSPPPGTMAEDTGRGAAGGRRHSGAGRVWQPRRGGQDLGHSTCARAASALPGNLSGHAAGGDRDGSRPAVRMRARQQRRVRRARRPAHRGVHARGGQDPNGRHHATRSAQNRLRAAGAAQLPGYAVVRPPRPHHGASSAPLRGEPGFHPAPRAGGRSGVCGPRRERAAHGDCGAAAVGAPVLPGDAVPPGIQVAARCAIAAVSGLRGRRRRNAPGCGRHCRHDRARAQPRAVATDARRYRNGASVHKQPLVLAAHLVGRLGASVGNAGKGIKWSCLPKRCRGGVCSHTGASDSKHLAGCCCFMDTVRGTVAKPVATLATPRTPTAPTLPNRFSLGSPADSRHGHASRSYAQCG
eukprot:ctg_713.g442